LFVIRQEGLKSVNVTASFCHSHRLWCAYMEGVGSKRRIFLRRIWKIARSDS